MAGFSSNLVFHLLRGRSGSPVPHPCSLVSQLTNLTHQHPFSEKLAGSSVTNDSGEIAVVLNKHQD